MNGTRKRVTYVGYGIASIVTLAVIAMLFPTLTGPHSSLSQRAFAIAVIAFFAYLSFRSTIYWQEIIATMTGSDKKPH